MSDYYRVHFGFTNRSKFYAHAKELADLAYKHDTFGEGDKKWHVVTLTDRQLDLMMHLYSYAVRMPHIDDVCSEDFYVSPLIISEYFQYNNHQPIIINGHKYKTSKAFLNLVKQDMKHAFDKLREEGYFAYYDTNTDRVVSAPKIAEEPIPEYRQIKDFIKKSNYKAAIRTYYDKIGNNYYGELTNELIYIKRLADIPLIGRDLLFFKPQGSRSKMVNSNIHEYVECIDEVLDIYHKQQRELPLDIIKKYAPTMESLVEKTQREISSGVDISNGQFEIDSSIITKDFFGSKYGDCYEGRLIGKYPDQVRYCLVKEYQEDPSYSKLWTNYPPKLYDKKIRNKGLYVNHLDVFSRTEWRRSKREPSFKDLKSKKMIKITTMGTGDIRYTGQSHKIEGDTFYEVDLIRRKEKPLHIFNPLIELIDEILREAENVLREKKGLPRIGQGWISEMQLFNLIAEMMPDSIHHASPEWLKPQHLDIFVPSLNLAFEYHGQQHFEPIEFFGGEKAYENSKKRDKRKKIKCKKNGVLLIIWRYDELIEKEVLVKKLKKYKVEY